MTNIENTEQSNLALCVRENSTQFCYCGNCKQERHGTITFLPNDDQLVTELRTSDLVDFRPRKVIKSTSIRVSKVKKTTRKLAGSVPPRIELYEGDKPHDFTFTCGKCARQSIVSATIAEIDGLLGITWSSK